MAQTLKTHLTIRILILICLVTALPGSRALAAPGDITRISVASGGAQGNEMSRWAQISGDGNFVVFESYASNLVNGDTNGFRDVFVHEAPFSSDPPPVVVSIHRADPNPTFTTQTVRYTVVFSEAVTGVDTGDFKLTKGGSTGGAGIGTVTGSGTTYTVTVGTGSGKGAIRLDLIDNDTIKDAANLPLGGAGAGNGNFITGQIYKIFILVSELFRSNGANDGWVLESGETTNQGGSLNAKNTAFHVGDSAKDFQARAVLHFPTATLQPPARMRWQPCSMRQPIIGIPPI